MIFYLSLLRDIVRDIPTNINFSVKIQTNPDKHLGETQSYNFIIYLNSKGLENQS